MNGGYTPLFGSLTTGTLCGRWPDVGLWPIVLSLADRHGVVDVTPDYIARVTGLPIEDVTACMARFCSPDPSSRSSADGGARLVPIDSARSWGWRVVNHAIYREKARKAAYDAKRTESGRDAERKREERAAHNAPTRPDAPRDLPLSNSNSNSNSNSSVHGVCNATCDATAEGVLDEYPDTPNGSRLVALRQIARLIDSGEATPEQLLEGARRFKRFVEAGGRSDSSFVKGPDKFFVPTKPNEPAPWSMAWDPPQPHAAAASATDATPDRTWRPNEEDDRLARDEIAARNQRSGIA